MHVKNITLIVYLPLGYVQPIEGGVNRDLGGVGVGGRGKSQGHLTPAFPLGGS